MMLFNISKRTLIFFMGVLFLLVLGFVFMYYQNQNKKVDPRITEARELYEKYDAYTENMPHNKVFQLLDSIENIYKSVPHYANSFETGVIHNNRAAVYLSMAIGSGQEAETVGDSLKADSLLRKSMLYAEKAIEIYTQWNAKFEGLGSVAVESKIKSEFLKDMPAGNSEAEEYLENRVREIIEALPENSRRLSVAYTNLGVAERHMGNYEQAMQHYQKALELWDRNLAAENNINILLGKPIRQRGVLEKLFPPDNEN